MSQLNGAYYGPSIPPPRKSYYRPFRGGGGGCGGCCCFCDCILSLICKILTPLIGLVVILVFLFWLIVRPNILKFHVTEASLTQFDYTNNTLNFNLNLNVSIRNPNRRLAIYYDRVQALALYHDVRFGNRTFMPSFLHHKSTTFLNPFFIGQRVMPLSKDQSSELDKEKGSGVYSIDLKLFMSIRFKFLFYLSHSVKTKIRCELHVPLKSRNATASSDAAFQPTKCDWDYKHWWIR